MIMPEVHFKSSSFSASGFPDDPEYFFSRPEWYNDARLKTPGRKTYKEAQPGTGDGT
jgi:hypothetical protein